MRGLRRTRAASRSNSRGGAARLALVGFRWDENSSFLRGAAEAPPLIRGAFASESSNRWSENGIELTRETFLDAGDFGPGSGVDMPRSIEASIA